MKASSRRFVPVKTDFFEPLLTLLYASIAIGVFAKVKNRTIVGGVWVRETAQLRNLSFAISERRPIMCSVGTGMQSLRRSVQNIKVRYAASDDRIVPSHDGTARAQRAHFKPIGDLWQS